MLRSFLLMLLAIPMLPGFAQLYRPQSTTVPKSPQYPLANQFEHLSVADGLSNNSVNCILQDRAGYMWFGTGEGLNKYDGYSFTVFRPDPAQPAHSFRNSIVAGLCEGDADQLWAITEGGGLHEVNTRTGLVTPHPVRADKANLWNSQISIYRDSQHRLWISTFAGLAQYEPVRHHFTLYPGPDADSPVKTVFEDSSHRFWIATQRGIYLLNRTTGQFTPVLVPGLTGVQPAFLAFYEDAAHRLWMGTATAGYSLFTLDLTRQPWRLEPYNPGGQLNQYVWRNTIHRDSTGIMWVGTTNGLHAIDPATNKVITYQTDPSLSKGLGSSNAQAVYHDRSGTIWIGTDNGIDRQAVNTKPFKIDQVTPSEGERIKPENIVNALLADNRGQLWSSNQSTIYRTSPNQRPLTSLSPKIFGSTEKHQNAVYSFLPDDRDGVWFGTSDGLYHLDQKSGQYKNYPSSIYAQYLCIQSILGKQTDVLWLGGDGGVASFIRSTRQYTYYKPGGVGGLPDRYVTGLMVSQFGEVWALIKRLGIWRFNPRTGQTTRYTAGAKGHLNTNDVQSIYEDKAGIIWIGTHGGGLNRFDWRTGLFSAITHTDGIPGSMIFAITGDESGHLWLSTDKGLCRIDPRTKAIHSYAVTDGLPSNEFLQNAVSRQTSRLFFGSMNGIVSFNPDRIQDDTRPFPVYITDLTVLDKPRPITDSIIRLKHDENILSFNFAGLAYEHSEQNQFAYQLVGVNPDWVQNGNRRVANFTNLAPGSYTFRVKAANSNGFWTPNKASIRVIVEPPWWATWWAYTLYGLLAGGAIWGYIRFYTNRIRQQQELELNRREAEQLKAVDELKTRFFSNITHEFRTPLALILSPVEKLLQEGRFDRPMLTLVQRNAGQLLRLINQLLDLAKLEGNYMAVSLMKGDVTEFIHHIADLFGRPAGQKGVTLTCVATGLTPQEYVFDADKWEKILTNLLSNALKFTNAGGHVTLTATPMLTQNGMTGVQIELVDSGIGIAAHELPHIFDRFYQTDSSSTRAYEGTGIGLALVQELVDLLGGTIAVESALGVGTTFRLTLPVQPISTVVEQTVNWSASEPIAQVSLPLPVAAPMPALLQESLVSEHPVPRILVVEDNDELREFLVGELASTYHVFQANDGQAGWEMVQAELPDIVITDVMMPRMDGHELTRLIRTHPNTDHIAVVMLTAKAAQQSRLEGLQQGADDYLAKPFNVAELQLRIRNLVTRQQKLGEHYRQQFALPGAVGLPLPAPTSPVVADPFLNRIYDLIEEHLDDSSIGVDWLADQLAMSRKTLYRKVQSLVQLPPADLIRQYRLRKAAELLQTGHNVSETADMTGFSTASHLSALFRESYGQTPTEFVGGRDKMPRI